MIELIYASAATQAFSSEALRVLLAEARKRNERDGITGLLIYHQGSFLQVLEGEESVVRATLDRIERDPRHGNIMMLLRSEISERSFASWRMGYIDLDSTGASLEGFSDFMRTGTAGLGRTEEAVARVLAAFRDGRYRPAIR